MADTASPRIITLGEVTIELARGKDGRFGLSCDGDTFNTAVYLARAGLNVSYATALGDDPYSEGVVSLLAAENIARDAVLRTPGRLPGLSLIDVAPNGERRRFLWNDVSPARELFELPEWPRVAEAMVTARLIYFSGITLSLYSNNGLGRLFATLELAHKRGAKIAFDCNFRPRAWKGDLSRARTIFIEALKRSDIALPAYDDEAVLWGDPSPESTLERMRAFGISEVAVKNGPNSVLVASAKEEQHHVALPEVVEVIDQSGAGDAFNAGYLAARLSGETSSNAAV
ncbi:MAG TPA: sugar kinase, partial [Xanthobacteraceae bacterium]|nr:sugar kinase [Xanthobacteraceae bacterium]